MKTKLVAVAALLLASVYPSTASAETLVTPGKLGPVTIGFTFTYDVGGFPSSKDKAFTKTPSKTSYYKLIADTETFYKELYSSVLVTSRYANAQLIADLINNEYLDPESKITNWSIVYVEAYDGEMRGFFAVNRKNDSVVFIGGYNQSGFPINLNSKDGSGYTESSVTTRVGPAMDPTSSTEIGTYNGVETYDLQFKPNEGTTFGAYALLNSQGTWRTDYVNDNSSYTKGLTNVSGIVGDDGDGTIIGGGLTIGGLSPVKDASAYIIAYQNAHSG